MAFNSSPLPDSSCSDSFLFLSNFSKSSSVYYQVTLTTCIVTSLLAPMAVVGNALIMAAIWKNPSLRTPSYVLLAGLAFTDFCTGLLSQPFFVMYELASLAGNRTIFCIAGFITFCVAYYFSTLTVNVMTIIAIERWLHMSRRSLLTVRRVVILYITIAALLIPIVAGAGMYGRYNANEFLTIFFLSATLCFVLTIFAYFKVFRIIRQHQSQVQTNQNAIDIEKYKKSVFTILYILAIFLLSYVPFVCCFFVAGIFNKFGIESLLTAITVCAAIVFSSSFANPLLYYWRIKEIRTSIRSIARNLFCKENGEES